MRRWLFFLLALVVAALAGDRIAVHYAQNRIAFEIRVSQGMRTDPTVTIKGFPFLTQALGGHYREVDVSGVDLVHGRFRASRVDSRLRGVDLGLSEALQGRVGAVPVDSVSLTAVLPWSTLEAAAPTPVGLSAARGGGVRVVSSVSGQTLAFTADPMVEGGQLVLVPREVAGRTIRLGTPDLPFHLKLTGARVGVAGVVVSAVGRHIVVNG